MSTIKIAFIGAGHISRALIEGLTRQTKQTVSLWVTNPTQDKLNDFVDAFSVQVSTDNVSAVCWADIVVLAVKPAQITQVCDEISSVLDAATMVVSLAAGVSLNTIVLGLNGHKRVVRAMPNVACALGSGVIGLYAEKQVSQTEIDAVFSLTGFTVWLSCEQDFHKVTALIGSGPAYFYLLMESLVAAAQDLSLPSLLVEKMIKEMAAGATALSVSSKMSINAIKESVCSSKGTTATALSFLEAHGFSLMIEEAVQAGALRSKELMQDGSCTQEDLQ